MILTWLHNSIKFEKGTRIGSIYASIKDARISGFDLVFVEINGIFYDYQESLDDLFYPLSFGREDTFYTDLILHRVKFISYERETWKEDVETCMGLLRYYVDIDPTGVIYWFCNDDEDVPNKCKIRIVDGTLKLEGLGD